MMTARDQPRKCCYQVDLADNVGTLLDHADAGPLILYGAAQNRVIHAVEPIALGHKIALHAISCGTPIIKYGVPIALSTRDIAQGEWVHLHNCRSQVDERSSHLDIRIGIAKDISYV